MHNIESYATSLGLTIDKPTIYENYYPVGDFDYITLSVGNYENQTYYAHWQDVINIMFPLLEQRNIKILQLNHNLQNKLSNCINVENPIEPNRLSYLLRQSKLHLSENGLDLDIASYNDKNIIFLDRENSGNLTFPFWNKQSNYIYLNDSENIKSINKIKPEKIAKYAFKFLDIEHKIDFETVYIGENYQNKSMQFIPDQKTDINTPQGSVMVVRMDKFFNEENLAKQLTQHNCVVVTNKEIDLNLIQNLKSNIHSIVYFIETKDNPDFIKSIQSMGINYTLMTYLNEEEIECKKINYMDSETINHASIIKQEDIEELKDLDINSLYYISNGPVLSNFKVFKSVFDYENKTMVENPSLPSQIKENLDFWKEVNNFHILKKIDTNPN